MRQLPAGRVTLVFTDVEGSTRLLHELAGGYAEALTEHRRVLREAFAAHGGVEVDTQGDAFFVAFTSPADAVRALLDANDGLAAGPIRIRAGVHTGEPHVTEEGYVGLDVHLGARIGAAGHGGQIVVSEAAARELGTEVPVTDLGEHRLKDFASAVRLFQVGLEEFPPLKTISNTNLPRPASAFFGRVDEVAVVARRIRDGARLVTLTGPGGSGKTRLAIEVAQELVPEFRSGVFWIELAPLRDATLVLETIARTLGARESLAEFVGARQMLLLLDNFEQVVDAATAVAELVERCPNLHVLVTSREVLRLRDEVEIPVLPLDRNDAVALFAERSGLEPDDTIRELCAALDNLPLAVELAAARVGVLSPAQILERLSGRLDLFRGARDADPRQRTLRETIDWSYELLAEDERRLFARLAVFAGGCTLDAAEAVADADLDTLEALVHKSLVRHTDERFWMLETIREYALEQLAAAPDAATLRRRHDEHYAALVEAAEPHLEGADQAVWLDRIEVDYANIRAALADDELRPRIAAGLAFFWAFHGYLDEGRRIAEAILGETPDDARVALGAGLLAVMQGDYDVARERAETAWQMAAERGPTSMLVHAASVLARALLGVGEVERAVALLEDALARAGDATERGVAIAHLNLGYIALVGRDFERARSSFVEAVSVARRGADQHAEARGLGALASVALESGHSDEALARAGECLAASPTNREVGAWALELAGVSLVDRDAACAAELLGAAEALREQLGLVQSGLELEQHERAVRMLGGAYAERWAAGRRLTLETAQELVGERLRQ